VDLAGGAKWFTFMLSELVLWCTNLVMCTSWSLY